MPFYKMIDASNPQGRRTIEGIQRLRQGLRGDHGHAIPVKTLDQSLIVASWNIREFGGTRNGGRDLEALLYLAEVIACFDLVAVQEVRDDLDALDRLMAILGPWWKFLVSDVTFGPAGNRERHAFIYDTRKLQFGGLAGELVPEAVKRRDGRLASDFAFARTPYLAGFQAGWFKFTICTQHAYYNDAAADDPQRVADAAQVARLLGMSRKSAHRWANNAILLGDFNVTSLDDETYRTIERANFEVPAGLRGKYTNARLDKPYDQIGFLAPDVQRQVAVARAGVVPFFDYVYRAEDWKAYKAKTQKSFLEWRTYKMSDHLPIWVELNVDFSDDYLARRLASRAPAGEPA
ncbi:MAG: endonuclease/exonuclease/phosphatase family protein [Polyangiaceae bacterium]|nr:endonuclease/exonuclease/phosphatase family protein [Polyangiaceae bacterium]